MNFIQFLIGSGNDIFRLYVFNTKGVLKYEYEYCLNDVSTRHFSDTSVYNTKCVIKL